MPDDLSAFKEEVRSRVDIAEIIGEYVDLKRRGVSVIGCCPFHNEKTPSFNVNREGQFFHCFGCGKGGDVFTFLMEITGMTFMEALEHLAGRVGMEMPQRRDYGSGAREQSELIVAANLAAAEYFYRTLQEEAGKAGKEYLESRGLTPETIKAFRLGFAPEDPSGLLAFAKKKGVAPDALDSAGILLKSKYGGAPYPRFGGRVMFPIIDPAARIIGFGGRILSGDAAKYLNSPETAVYHKSRVLFGLYQAKEVLKKSRTAIVVEGYMDVISLHQAGVKNAIAASGTSFTAEQGRIISRLARSVILLFDGDSAGISAAARGADNLLATDLAITVSVLPGGHDPDSYVRELGVDALREHLEQAMDIWEFKLLALSRGTVGPEDRIRLAGEIADSISLIPEELKREIYAKDLSLKLGIDVNTMLKAVNGRIRKRAAQKDSGPPTGEQPRTPVERELFAAILSYPDLARHFMQEAGSKPFSSPPLKKAVEVIFHRLVEGLEVSASALMNALDDPDAQQAVAAAAMLPMDEETAQRYIEKYPRELYERELRAEIRETGRRIVEETDPRRREELQRRQNTLKYRLSALLNRTPKSEGNGK